MREVWDTGWMGATKTLDVHVSTLRRKLGDDPSAPRYIHTVRGVGFRFRRPTSSVRDAPRADRPRAFYVLRSRSSPWRSRSR